MARKQAEAGNKNIIVEYYTDPLCCWSWAFQPHWQKFITTYKAPLEVRYFMGGLLPQWNNYNDTINAVTKPFQLGAVWTDVEEITGIKLNSRIWFDNPPKSSYPACIAVKTAELQSKEAGALYLEQVRKKVMVEGKDISTSEILKETAFETEHINPAVFSAAIFMDDLYLKKGLEPFNQDLNTMAGRKISRFPTIIIKDASNKKKKGILIAGYRPYEIFIKTVDDYLFPANKIIPSASF